MGRAHFLNNYFRNGVNITFPLYPHTEVKFTNFVVEIIAVNDFKIDTTKQWRGEKIGKELILSRFFLFFCPDQVLSSSNFFSISS